MKIHRKIDRTFIGAASAAGLVGLLLVGCSGTRTVSMTQTHESRTVKVAKVDRDGAERVHVHMTGPSGGEFRLARGETIVMGDAELRIDDGRLMIANAGEGVLTTRRAGEPGRMDIGQDAVGQYALGGDPVIVDGVEFRFRR